MLNLIITLSNINLFLVVAAPPLVRLRFRLSFASRLLRWLVVTSPFVASPSPCVVRRHLSPPSLVDCCRFHRHRRVNVYPPLLPLRSLCCACHRRPSPSRHPSPPSLVDCCIFHVHCRIAVYCRCFIAPTIAVNAVAVALPSCHLLPLPSHRSVAVASPSRVPLPLPLFLLLSLFFPLPMPFCSLNHDTTTSIRPGLTENPPKRHQHHVMCKSVRVHPYAHPQHIKVLKHVVYI